jgi:nicotinamidase-related amidase
VPVVVRNPDLQEGVLDPGFEYFLLPAPVVTDVIPNTGSVVATTGIRITGSNFQPAEVLVFFDRIPAVPLPAAIDRATSSATAINAVTPAVLTPVTMDVRVENPDGQFAIKPGGFTYTP